LPPCDSSGRACVFEQRALQQHGPDLLRGNNAENQFYFPLLLRCAAMPCASSKSCRRLPNALIGRRSAASLPAAAHVRSGA
jgi:hypothetical protein